ncbi:MAG: hypothetical protein AB7O62_18900 [Pirellulales bacterium]
MVAKTRRGGEGAHVIRPSGLAARPPVALHGTGPLAGKPPVVP